MANLAEKRMHSPAHPGEVLRELYLKPLGITITQAANLLLACGIAVSLARTYTVLDSKRRIK